MAPERLTAESVGYTSRPQTTLERLRGGMYNECKEEVNAADEEKSTRLVEAKIKELIGENPELAKLYIKSIPRQFIRQIICAGLGEKLQHYRSFLNYRGPAVMHDNTQFVVAQTTMLVRWDRLNRDQYVIYPHLGSR